MVRTIFYFDGFNFYNGLKDKSENSPKWKSYYWLDFTKFCNSFLNQYTHILVNVNYFTAPPSNSEKRSRQLTLFNANKIIEGNKFTIINGNYQDKQVKCNADCKKVFYTQEEKRTDVAIATKMLSDCFLDTVDLLILVSADSDQIPSLRAINNLFPKKKIKIYFPPKRYSDELQKTCRDVIKLEDNESKFSISVMPNIVTNSIKTYTKPTDWA